jgi:hypothetical protein
MRPWRIENAEEFVPTMSTIRSAMVPLNAGACHKTREPTRKSCSVDSSRRSSLEDA